MTGWACVCGGRAYTGAELVAMSADDPVNADMWRALLGPDDFYCSDEDDVLTEEEGWRVRGLQVPCHDARR